MVCLASLHSDTGISFGELGKMLGERWKGMTADEKAPYEKMAAKDKIRYAEALKAYKEKGGGAAAGNREGSDGVDDE